MGLYLGGVITERIFTSENWAGVFFRDFIVPDQKTGLCKQRKFAKKCFIYKIQNFTCKLKSRLLSKSKRSKNYRKF